MKKTSPDVITVPIISTTHMPGERALVTLKDAGAVPVMLFEYGGMLYVDYTDVPWVKAIAESLDAPDGWVRLDSLGPVIPGIPVYDWD
jgi:hypothetical protein